MTGYYTNDSIKFGATTLYNSSPGNSNMFIARYNSSGYPVWAKTAVNSGKASGKSITTDNSGNIYVSGNYLDSTLAFGSNVLSNAGEYDVFICKYDSSGNILWAKSIGGPDVEHTYSLSSDGYGNTSLVGHFNSAYVSVGSHSLTCIPSYYGDVHMFMASYDSDGSELWTKQSEALEEYSDHAYAVHTSASGNIFVGGFYSNRILVDTVLLSGSRMYIIKLASPYTSLTNNSADLDVKSYPNPFEGKLCLSYESLNLNEFSIKIFNIQGQMIYSENIPKFKGKYNKELDLSRHSKGIYNIEIVHGNEKVVKRVVLN
jgi:hypothetical protein